MKNTITFLLTFFCLSISAQIKFEKGYIINNENQKIECLIKNPDWSSIPNEIEYKMTDSSAIEKATIYDITGFKIYNTDHYYKKISFSFDENENDKSENIKKITSFLKVLVEGQANLYEYKGYTFLYETNSGGIKQLVYKKYKNQENRMYQDFAFRKELYNNLNCNDNKINIRLLRYKRKDLINYFKSYNICKNSKFEVFIPKKTKAKFNFNIFSGIGNNNSNTSFNDSYTFTSASTGINDATYTSIENINFGNLLTYNFGFEAEIILPIQRYKWSFFISPNYNFQNDSKVQKYDYKYGSFYDLNIKVNKINYVEIPFGLKHYFYLNNNSKLNLGMAYNLIYLTKDKNLLEIKNNSGILARPSTNEVISSNYISFTTGYTYKNKYSVSINYYPSKKFSQENQTVSVENSIFLLLKYNIL